MQAKINLLDLTLLKLEQFFLEMGEKKFRAIQVFRWLHVNQVDDLSQMTDIAKSLRQKLEESSYIKTPKVVEEQFATDGVIKWVLEMGEGNRIETVYIPEEGRATLCISSQVGCALECQFCSTGRQGFNRNLTVGEIIGQLWLAKKRIAAKSKQDKVITNVVMMGMGEPLANYTSVVDAMNIMLDDNAYNISKRKLTLSTSGMVPGILKLKEDCPVSLAISLHASNDQIRNEIIPLNQKYPLKDLLAACKSYLEVSPREFITFEYVMLKGVNDQIEHALELNKLVKGLPCKFNLIPFNKFPNSGFVSSPITQILKFQRVLQEHGHVTTIRKTRGENIDGACGQLAGKVKDKTTRQEKWSKYIPIMEQQ